MIDREKVINELKQLHGSEETMQIISEAIVLLKEQEAQRNYEASVEMAEYCERYEPTYNPEDGSM